MRALLTAALCVTLVASAAGQDVPLQYRVKAAFLYNFLKFVEWPPDAARRPLTICVAGESPFGSVLDDTLSGESLNGRAVSARTVTTADPSCHVLFVPQDVPALPYLRGVRMSATPTVGERPDFLDNGGVINFVAEGGSIRFQINRRAADRAGLRISSHLLRLARAEVS